jgi:hypothetical protein
VRREALDVRRVVLIASLVGDIVRRGVESAGLSVESARHSLDIAGRQVDTACRSSDIECHALE